MNQDQVKSLLFKLEPEALDFSVIYTGKKSLKVHGLYKPESKEILLHNKNFQSDTQLVYTAIHEFAHHLHFTGNAPPNSTRSHTRTFWNLFHGLLRKAEDMGIYSPDYFNQPELQALTDLIKSKYIQPHGDIMKAFGEHLLEAKVLCDKFNLNFEDYLDRVLQIERGTAKTVISSYKADIPSRFGYETMKILNGVADHELRNQLVENLDQGFSPDMLKEKIHVSTGKIREMRNDSSISIEKIELLKKEKIRLEKNLAVIKEKIDLLDKEIHLIHSKETDDV